MGQDDGGCLLCYFGRRFDKETYWAHSKEDVRGLFASSHASKLAGLQTQALGTMDHGGYTYWGIDYSGIISIYIIQPYKKYSGALPSAD